MKLECSIEKLKTAVSQVEKITGKNLTLPILNSILLIGSGKSLKLRAMNLSLGIEVEIPAKIEKDGIIAIPGSVLADIFNNISTNELITIEEVDSNLLLKTKKNKIKVKGQPSDDFPTIPTVSGDEFNIPAKKFLNGIKSVYYSSSLSDIKPEISSIFIYTNEDDLVFVATDSFRLAEKKIKIKGLLDIQGILIPHKNILEIIRIFSDVDEDIKISFNKNQISFSVNNIYLTSRVIDGVFPDYRQIIPKESKTEVVVLKQDIVNALKISNIFSDKFNQLYLNIQSKEKNIEFFSQNNDIGENRTKIDGTIKGDSVELSFNYKYFLDCLSSITTDSLVLKLNDPNKPMLINPVSDNSFTYLIMPMNR